MVNFEDVLYKMGYVLCELSGIKETLCPVPGLPMVVAGWHWPETLAATLAAQHLHAPLRVSILFELSRAQMSIPVPRTAILLGQSLVPHVMSNSQVVAILVYWRLTNPQHS